MFEGATSSTVRPRRQEGVSTQYTSGVRSVVVAKEERNIVNNQQSGGGSGDFSAVPPMDEELFRVAKRLREQIRLVRKPTETPMGEKSLTDAASAFNEDRIWQSIPEGERQNLREAVKRLRTTVRLRRNFRDSVSANNSVEGFTDAQQSKEVQSISETDSDERQSRSSGSLVSQGIPLSAQALRFEIQTREVQLRTITDQGERGRIQSQLNAYRGLLRESEQGTANEENRPIQGIPLSAQALRFEIQTREAQLRTITDQGERGRIQSQLNAYRGLLRESEQGTANTEQVSAPIHDRTPRITPSSIWNRVRKWFSW